jgi:SWI/SNF-related matrix-associated actin-dependent regulator 1 of chromatin subfamily A
MKAVIKQREGGAKVVKIFFRYDPALVAKVRELPQRRFINDSKVKHWEAPALPSTLELLKKWGFSIEDQTQSETNKISLPEGLSLFPFQEKGVQFIESRNGRALVADEQGLGKTIQALAWLRLHPEKRPAVVVCPNSVKLNWAREARKWLDEATSIHVIFGKDADTLPKADIYIINYDILLSWLSHLKIMDPKVLIIDETSMIKNKSAKRTKALQELARGVPHIIGLSGTPIINRPVEGFTILHMIDPRTFPKFWDYAQRYCGARWTRFGWDFSGASRTKELHELLTSTVMIRRKKADVLTELPDKIRTVVPIQFDSKEYDKLEREFRDWLREEKGTRITTILSKIEYLRQFIVNKKLPQVIEWLEDVLESTGGNGNGKVVVFYHHKELGDKLESHFQKISVRIDGDTPAQKRQEYVDRFQNDPEIRVFLGNIQAAGMGITLTAASTVVFIELPWAPALLDQAEDRCHRIGQKYVVNVYYLVAAGTIEEDMAKVLDQKRQVVKMVLDGKEAEADENLVRLLVEEIERRA